MSWQSIRTLKSYIFCVYGTSFLWREVREIHGAKCIIKWRWMSGLSLNIWVLCTVACQANQRANVMKERHFDVYVLCVHNSVINFINKHNVCFFVSLCANIEECNLRLFAQFVRSRYIHTQSSDCANYSCSLLGRFVSVQFLLLVFRKTQWISCKICLCKM